MRHLIDPLDFSQEEITSLLDLADRCGIAAHQGYDNAENPRGILSDAAGVLRGSKNY